MREYIITVMSDEPLSALKAGETIQAVMKTSGDCDELVRCKDCFAWNEEEQHGCTHDMGANDFCSKAERKEE